MPDGQKTVLSYGETLWDLLPDGAVLGGAPFNFAYRVGSLGDCAVMASRLGRDDLGNSAFSQITALGMDTALIQWDEERPTGTVQVSLDARGNPDFHIVPDVAYDRIAMNAALARAAASADCLCFGTLIQRAETSRSTLYELLAASPRSLKFLDINLRKNCFTEETVARSLDEADILKLNDAEARQIARVFSLRESGYAALSREVMDRWSLSHCLVTFGERGALVSSRDGGQVYVPGYRVKVADTCGSGDAFAAGFIHAHLAGRPLLECCALANVMGAIVATQKGATAPLANADIARFEETPHERLFEPGLESLAAL